MSSKFFKFGLMAVLALSMAACDDDSDNNKGGNNGGNDNPAPSVVCTEGVSECDGNNLKRCVNNNWQSTPCNDGCDAAAKQCIVPAGVTPKCTENDKRCNGDNLETCISNDWHVDKCDNGCDAAAKQCKSAPQQPEPDNSCKDGDLKCDGNDLKVCASKAWTVKEACANGCDASKKACKAGSNPDPGTCTSGETKCEGNYVSTCSGGGWQKAKNECPYGCENGACKKQGSTPGTGSGDSYCDGEVLHIKDSEGKDNIEDCASYDAKYGIKCQKLKDGSSACVYAADSQAAALCKADQEILNAQCVEYSGMQILDYVICTKNSKDETIAVETVAISACGINEGKMVAVFCDTEDGSEYKTYVAECGTCTDSGKYTAICDGTEVVSDGSGTEAADEYVVCDDKCVTDEKGTKCADACKAEGYNYCYANYATGDLKCSKEEVDPSTISNDDPFYCGDEKLTTDDGEITGTEACGDANTVAICVPAEGGMVSLLCLDKCTTKGDSKNVCELDSENKGYEYKATCGEIDGKMCYIPSDIKDCTSTCNDAGTACK